MTVTPTLPEVVRVFGVNLQLSHILLVISVCAFFGLLIRWHYSRQSKFDLTDAFLDQKTNRASFDSIITACFAILAFWWVVTETLGGNKDAGSRLIDILGIFILYRGAKQAIGAYESKPPTPAVPIGDNIAQQVVVPTIESTAVVKPPVTRKPKQV